MLLRMSDMTASSSAAIVSGVMAVGGLPDPAASETLVQPAENSLRHLVAVEYPRASLSQNSTCLTMNFPGSFFVLQRSTLSKLSALPLKI